MLHGGVRTSLRVTGFMATFSVTLNNNNNTDDDDGDVDDDGGGEIVYWIPL